MKYILIVVGAALVAYLLAGGILAAISDFKGRRAERIRTRGEE